MGGLVFGSMMQGLGAGVSTAGSSLMQHQMRQDDIQLQMQGRRDIANDRMDMHKQISDDRIAAQKERDADRLAARGGKDGPFMEEIKPGSMAEEAMAGQARLSVPEMNRVRYANKTGDRSSYDVTQQLPGPTEDGAPLTGKQAPAGLDEYLKDKGAVLAEIQWSTIYGKNANEVMQGRERAQKISLVDDVVNGRRSGATVAEAEAAGKGEGAFGKGNVSQFSGSADAVGKSVITENNAKARHADAEAGKANSDASGTVRPRDMLALIDAQRKTSDKDLENLRAARKIEIDTALSPTAKKAIIDAYQLKETDLLTKRGGLDEQVDYLRAKQGMPGRAKPGDNISNVKPSAAATIDALPAGSKQVGTSGNVKPSSGPTIKTLPPGSKQVGTSGGKPVYQTPGGELIS